MNYPGNWEYLTIPELPKPDLNEFGADGWELTSVSNGTLYFKRPTPNFRERVTLDQKRDLYLWKRIPLPSEEDPKA